MLLGRKGAQHRCHAAPRGVHLQAGASIRNYFGKFSQSDLSDVPRRRKPIGPCHSRRRSNVCLTTNVGRALHFVSPEGGPLASGNRAGAKLRRSEGRWPSCFLRENSETGQGFCGGWLCIPNDLGVAQNMYPKMVPREVEVNGNKDQHPRNPRS